VRTVGGGHSRFGLVGQSQKELSQAALGSGIISQDRRECGVSQRFWETLTKSLSGASIVRKPATMLVNGLTLILTLIMA
jgi:hypothetical protein